MAGESYAVSYIGNVKGLKVMHDDYRSRMDRALVAYLTELEQRARQEALRAQKAAAKQRRNEREQAKYRAWSDQLNLSLRAATTVERAVDDFGFTRIFQLTDSQWLDYPNCGKVTLAEIRTVIPHPERHRPRRGA